MMDLHRNALLVVLICAPFGSLGLGCGRPGEIVAGTTGGKGGGGRGGPTVAGAKDSGAGGAFSIDLDAAIRGTSMNVESDATDEACAAYGVKLIYVVDISRNLFSFDPSKENTFTRVNTLNCPGLDGEPGYTSATPFSMGVDRSGMAWVLYSDGAIYNVDVTTNDAPCKAMKPAWTPGKNGFRVFGMSFVAASPGASTERLYIAYDDFGYIEPSSLQVTTLATTPKPLAGTEHTPELTGTGNSLLYGYYPGFQVNYVALFDQANGAVKQTWNMPKISGPGTQSIAAWAFAHYGGRLYAFVTHTSSGETGGPARNSQVYVLDPSSPTNTGKLLLDNTGHEIVGAGVSTCAPTTQTIY